MTATTLLRVQEDVLPRLRHILLEVNDENFEREEITWSMVVALVSQQHLLMVGPGGTGKSQLVRHMVRRIADANYFETALDETSTPDQVLGPPDIKAMVDDGRTRRIPDGMLPEAHYAFIDEIFNGNGPVLHAVMPLLNERIFHNNGQPTKTPLRSVFCGTNKLNADADMAAMWDRVHLRHQVSYVRDRDKLDALFRAAMLRQISNYQPAEPTTVTVSELDAAHDEAMALPVPDAVMTMFLDLIETLGRDGVEVSTRRQVEGLKAVLANAWLSGHREARIGDLSILQHMFWTTQDQIGTVKSVILSACNPGEKRALELLVTLDELNSEYRNTADLDEVKRNNIGVDLFKKVCKIEDAADGQRAKSLDVGVSTARLDDLLKQTRALKIKIGTEVFSLSADEVIDMRGSRR